MGLHKRRAHWVRQVAKTGPSGRFDCQATFPPKTLSASSPEGWRGALQRGTEQTAYSTRKKHLTEMKEADSSAPSQGETWGLKVMKREFCRVFLNLPNMYSLALYRSRQAGAGEKKIKYSAAHE